MISDKIYSLENLLAVLPAWKKEGKIVFTNGCFDILHPGHADYLEKARVMGSCLIAGINTDNSVRRLKGPSRPVNDENTRARMLAALESVNAVVLFEEDTPYELISAIKPDILVKGDDYTPDKIVGADVVIANGGRVETVALLKGYSTTGMIEKIRKVK